MKIEFTKTSDLGDNQYVKVIVDGVEFREIEFPNPEIVPAEKAYREKEFALIKELVSVKLFEFVFNEKNK